MKYRLAAFTANKGGGRPIAQAVTADVVSIVHQHVLDRRAPEAAPTDVIRAGAFVIRRIGGAPGVDRIAKVEVDAQGRETELELSCLTGPDFVDACERGTEGGSR